MKTILTFFTIVFLSFNAKAQKTDNIGYFLAAGIEDAEKLSSLYLTPAAEGLLYGLTGGWFNTASTHEKFGFELSVIINGSFIPSKKKLYTLDVSQFENIQLTSGATQIDVATILGEENETVEVEATIELNGQTRTVTFDLPSGIGLADINFLPTAFLQGSLGLPKKTDLKLRYFPKIKIDEAKIGMYGMAAQHEISQWIPSMPFTVSGLIAYTRLDGEYDLTTSNANVSATNDFIELKMNSWLFHIIASKKVSLFDFYGAIGYVTGDSNLSLKGDYTITVQDITKDFSNPISIQNNISGMKAAIGTNMKFGFFSLNLNYSFQEFNNLSVGLNFAIR